LTPAYPAIGLREPAVQASSIRYVYGVERFVAFLALAVLAPPLLIVAVAIAVLSKRGPLVSHSRVGHAGARLEMIKFRTMWDDTRISAPWFAIERVSGPVCDLKDSADIRVSSRFAAFCRRHSLDELPQLFHVVRGEMSLVGPRPITRRELECHYGEDTTEVLSVRPGMTGLWQVKGRSQLTYARRRRLDLIFVRKASPALYARILMLSLPQVIRGSGA
jgi:lipopolysaccharide/colanic/teichoic acid biosynthesis glycosyltransferase